jgi:hypothetical protein
MRTRWAPEFGALRPRMRPRLVPALSAGTLPPQVIISIQRLRRALDRPKNGVDALDRFPPLKRREACPRMPQRRRAVTFSRQRLEAVAKILISAPMVRLLRYTGRMRGTPSRWLALPLMCRFSDAGMTKLSTRSDGRRPKSAKARNRGGVEADGAAGAMGIWRRRECWGRSAGNGDWTVVARTLGVRAGANERIAGCSTGFAVRSRASFADRGKRGWCRARAGHNGICRCGVGSAMPAS